MKKSIQNLYTRLSETIVLTIVFLLFSAAAMAQSTVSGKVTDSKDGSPVAGVTVVVKGTKVSTQTNTDGGYTLSVPKGGTTLVFTSVGFTKQELPISGTSADVKFVSSSQQLNEVVVVGYGTTRKKDLTGAVTAVSSKDFNKGSITTAEQLIAGKVAGVNIISNGGAPGSGSTIRIRGGASLKASNDPLIIIDGVQLSGGGISGSANPLALINPNDIETFNILKDASAAAIYGSRGSNGVIIITTKKGKSGKPVFNFNTQLSVGTVAKKINVLSADQFRDYINANGTTTQKSILGTANTDWQDEIFRDAISNDNNLSVSGGLKGKVNLPYRLSVGYLNQNGILNTDNLQRVTASINLNPKFLNDHLKLDISVKASNTKSKFANQDALGSAVSFDPTQPVKSGSSRYDGYTEWLDAGAQTGLNALAPKNPVSLLTQRKDKGNVDRLVGNVQLDYKFHFLPDLHANVNFGYDLAKGTGTTFWDDSAAAKYKRGTDTFNVLKGGQNTNYQQKINNISIEYYLNYVKDIKSIHSRIDATAGYGYYDNLTKNYSYADYFADGSKVKGSDPVFAFDEPRSRLVSFYGRLNYSYKSKYLITVNVRDDGSSRLSKDNRWLLYHSEAFAWKIKEESFLRDSRTFSDLKLRIGYGITGQQDGIGLYDYIANYEQSNTNAKYQFGNNYYYMFRPKGYNPNLTWEQTATTNVALDFGLWNNRVSGSVDFYIKKTKNLLNDLGQSAGTNFAVTVLGNVGEMENKGVELTLNTQPIRSKDLTLDLGFNVSYNKNKITKLTFNDNDPTYPGLATGLIDGGTGSNIEINSVGYSRNAFYVYQQVYDAAGKPIEGLFVDRNRDGVIDTKDKYRYKSANPDVFLGFNGNLQYKKWNAGFVMRSSLGNYVYNNINSNTGNKTAIITNSFLRNGYASVIENNFVGGGTGEAKYSDYFVENASFLRMDNLNVGYSFGKVFNKKSDLRVNFSIQNVFIITKYKGIDPEITDGLDKRLYPRPRTFVLGVNLDF